jgi:hypothetical protein
MLASAVNFALGFFAWPLDGKYEQVITIEAPGVCVDVLRREHVVSANLSQFNNTLAPYDTCPNANIHGKSDRSLPYIKKWAGIYLARAQMRLQADLRPAEGGEGFHLEIEDLYRMQQMCAYEVTYRGSSRHVTLADGHVQDCRTRLFQILRAVHRG